MKKNYIAPEIEVSRFVVEAAVTASAADMTAGIFTDDEGNQTVNYVETVNYADIFGQGTGEN